VRNQVRCWFNLLATARPHPKNTAHSPSRPRYACAHLPARIPLGASGGRERCERAHESASFSSMTLRATRPSIPRSSQHDRVHRTLSRPSAQMLTLSSDRFQPRQSQVRFAPDSPLEGRVIKTPLPSVAPVADKITDVTSARCSNLHAEARSIFGLHLRLYARARPASRRSRPAATLRGQRALRPPNGAHSRGSRADPPTTWGRAQHRGSHISRTATRSTLTGQAEGTAEGQATTKAA
jgi:hypothetical protein